MILLPFASEKTYGVLGLGKSGRATVTSLLASGAQVMMWDDSEKSRTAAAQEFPNATLADSAQWPYALLAALVVSPGIFLTHPAVLAAEKAGVEVIGDIELLYRAQPSARYVTITGTNGKSTTTTLIAHILKACGKRVEVGGNLGTPALALQELSPRLHAGASPEHASGDPGMRRDDSPIYVLELSSYQLDLVRTTKFNVAVLLNISPDHLDHHGNMENYIAAKMHIFDRMREGDVAVVGVDDTTSEAIADRMLRRSGPQLYKISGGVVSDADVRIVDGNVQSVLGGGPLKNHRTISRWLDVVLGSGAVLLILLPLALIFLFFIVEAATNNPPLAGEIIERLLDVAEPAAVLLIGWIFWKACIGDGHADATGDIATIKSLQGTHNHQNAAAAYAACIACGCEHDAIIAAMQTYPGLAHRMEWLGEMGGVQYVNDSKATNADAAEKALLTYDTIYWVIGGVAKEGGIEPLEKYFPKIRHAYLIGEAANAFAKTLEGKVKYTHCGTLENAFTAATADARREGAAGAAVLLSPACASFDQYPNFEVRGEAFVKLFKALKTGGADGSSAA